MSKPDISKIPIGNSDTGMTGYRSHASDLIRAPQQGQPEGIFTWVKLPNGNIRLYASRNLLDVAWGQREHVSDGVFWHLDANLGRLLVVDRPTPAEALTFVLEKWAREDADALAEQAEPGYRERIRAAEAERGELRPQAYERITGKPHRELPAR